MLEHLSNNPNVLRSYSRQHFRGDVSEATFLNGTFDLCYTRGKPLRHPMLNDRLPKATEVRVYPKSAHVRVI